MIERKILYYPTILVPSRWLKFAALYWDKASSIIPHGWEDKPVLVHPLHKRYYYTMDYLWKEGLFEPTRPADFWHEPSRRSPALMRVRALEDEFKEIVNSSGFQVCINRNWQSNPIDRIHEDKLSHRIVRFLRNLKLAILDKQDPSWFFVERNTSLLYMGLLAKHLADADIDYTVTSTDRDEYENMVYGSNIEDQGFPSFKTKFLDILPIPRDDVSVRDIVRFKRKRQDELLQFRRVMDELQKEISNAKSEDEIKLILVQQRERIQGERSSLNKIMKRSGIKTVFATLRSLISIKSPALYETLGFSLIKTPPQISVPIIAGTAFVQVGYAWIDNRNKQRTELRKSPFSYLYYAEKEKLV